MKPATYNTEAFDEWIRSRFVELNSQLEQLYYQQTDRANVQNIGTELKQTLESEGRELIKALLDEGNTDEGYISLGTGIGSIRGVKSVADVVNELTV